MNISSYKNYLSSRGNTLGQVKRIQSDVIMNNTFTLDPTYKKVYILTKEGWKWEDAKYQFHSAPSISKDAVDYYLQFRPKVHYPVGSYVIVPDDTAFDINLSEEERLNPFSQPIENRKQWWIIVGRDEANAYVRYMILKCDWDFKWIYKGKLMSCWACSKSASSYTSGRWVDQYSASLDNLTNSWLPDTHHVYGDKLEELGMCDTRTVFYNQRFFLSNNDLEPKIYQVTKVLDINPLGIIKLSIKQDELNEKRDNIELRICDYYTDEGDVMVDIPIVDTPDAEKTSTINWLTTDDDGELVDGVETKLEIGTIYYFGVTFSADNVDPQWKIELIDENDEFTDEDKEYYVGLMKMTKFDNTILALKPAKASSLKGKKFTLSVSDSNGEYYSSIDVEVAE
jgi:hypothetical protein